jgi:hypothetical protein
MIDDECEAVGGMRNGRFTKVLGENLPQCHSPSILVLDAICGHISEEVKVTIERKNCDLVVIPSGMTTQLQPLSVLVNEPFKDI